MVRGVYDQYSKDPKQLQEKLNVLQQQFGGDFGLKSSDDSNYNYQKLMSGIMSEGSKQAKIPTNTAKANLGGLSDNMVANLDLAIQGLSGMRAIMSKDGMPAVNQTFKDTNNSKDPAKK
jgi:hypothetical protein